MEEERCPFCVEWIKDCDHFDEDGNLREEYFSNLVDDEWEEGYQERW